MQRSGVITITTDFGHKGPFSAIMKGVILTRFPDASIVDLIHDIPAQWPPEAGFWVSASYTYFPRGTVHVAIVDPGVGTERKILLAECDDQLFMAPDNGLLAQLLDRHPDAAVYHLIPDAVGRLDLGETSNTFHGRDIFAPIAADVAAGKISFADIGTPTRDWIPNWVDEPQINPDRVEGVIITIDTFGNLISTIETTHINDIAEPVVDFAGRQFPVMETYGRAQPGEYLALINSFGFVEIARAEGNAADALGAGRGAPVIVRNGLSV